MTVPPYEWPWQPGAPRLGDIVVASVGPWSWVGPIVAVQGGYRVSGKPTNRTGQTWAAGAGHYVAPKVRRPTEAELADYYLNRES